jgi:outer membrane protein assembly factor BamB
MAVFGAFDRARADGELRFPGPFVMGSSSQSAYISSSAAVDAAGTVYVTNSFGGNFDSGRIWSLTPIGNTDLHKNWTHDFPEGVVASPVVSSDGTVYVGTLDGILYAFDRETGDIKWTRDLNQIGLPFDPGLVYIASTVALSSDGSTIYVGVGTYRSAITEVVPGAIVALGSDSNVRWKQVLPEVVDGPAPVVGAHGTIYVGVADKNLYAFNPDGTEKWHRAFGAEPDTPAIGGDGTIFVPLSGSQFVALTPDNQVKWQLPLTCAGSPAVGADGSVYIGNFSDANLYSIDGATGKINWQSVAAPALGCSPTIRADGIILYGGTDRVVRAYKPADGSVVWSRTIGGQIRSAPVISPADGGIFITAGNALYGLLGNEYRLSQYSSWPTYQHDGQHTGHAPERAEGARLLNLSARGPAGPGRNLIAGLTMQGNGTKRVLIRAVGPTLGAFGIANPLPDPRFTGHVRDFTNVPYQNNDWGISIDASDAVTQDDMARVGAFPLAAGSRDAAVIASIAGSLTYTTTVDSADGASGVAMVEVYDADLQDTGVRLINLSTRGFVGNGEGVLIGGMSIGGNGKIRVLVRAIGPGLQPFQVPNVLGRPSITVYDQAGKVMGSNAGWTSDHLKGDYQGVFSLVGAFPLPDGSADSAMILTLTPGIYTFHVAGESGATGEAMVEAYALPY